MDHSESSFKSKIFKSIEERFDSSIAILKPKLLPLLKFFLLTIIKYMLKYKSRNLQSAIREKSQIYQAQFKMHFSQVGIRHEETEILRRKICWFRLNRDFEVRLLFESFSRSIAFGLDSKRALLAEMLYQLRQSDFTCLKRLSFGHHKRSYQFVNYASTMARNIIMTRSISLAVCAYL